MIKNSPLIKSPQYKEHSHYIIPYVKYNLHVCTLVKTTISLVEFNCNHFWGRWGGNVLFHSEIDVLFNLFLCRDTVIIYTSILRSTVSQTH